ncbi:MAG: ribonuclease III [Armatimonadia bacterium]
MAVPEWNEVRSELNLPDMPDDLLRLAFQHGSYVREHGLDANQSNQRLEFLGDAVLDLIVADELFRQNPDVPEGILTKTKAAAVRAGSLAQIAQKMNLGRYLMLGRGEEESGGRTKSSLLSDAVESLLGAIYLAAGLEATRQFLLPYLDLKQHSAEPGFNHFDHKTRLQELLQSHLRQLPKYHVAGVEGPDHDLKFTVEVHFGGVTIGVGTGPSKRKAEQAAARHALEAQDEWLPRALQADRATKEDPSRG